MTKYAFEDVKISLEEFSSVQNSLNALIVGFTALAATLETENPGMGDKLLATLDKAYKMNAGTEAQNSIAQLAQFIKFSVARPEEES